MTMPIKNFSTLAPHLNDEEFEAQVFRDLEAQQQAWLAKDDGLVLHQYPDERTMFLRLRAWWYLRQQRVAPKDTHNGFEVVSEPDWPRHWATTKYI